jgi:DNA-binding MarR family transcriptional regulator
MAKKVGGHNEIKRVPFRLDTNPFYLMYQTLSRAMEGLDEALDPHKVTFTQFRVLSNLYEQDERTITELAELTRIESSAVGRAVADLARRGLIERHSGESDGRVTEVHLTAAGRKLFLKVLPAIVSQIDDAVSDLSREEFLQLNDLLRRIWRTLDESKSS